MGQNMDMTRKSFTQKKVVPSQLVKTVVDTTKNMTTYNSTSDYDELLLKNEEFMSATDFVRFYTDKSFAYVGNNSKPLLLEWQQNNGVFVDMGVGASIFDGHVEPTWNLTAGYQGRWYQCDINLWLQKDYQTLESDRPGQPFFGLNTYVSVKGKVLDLGNHHFQVWAGPRLGYRFNMDYHENDLGTTVTETDTEIITTSHKSTVDLGASTVGYDFLQLQMVWKPRWSCFQLVANASYGKQQRFYANGNRWHDNWQASLGVRWNILGTTRHQNKFVIKDLKLSDEDLRAARRASK
jgi:hypothetical protein